MKAKTQKKHKNLGLLLCAATVMGVLLSGTVSAMYLSGTDWSSGNSNTTDKNGTVKGEHFGGCAPPAKNETASQASVNETMKHCEKGHPKGHRQDCKGGHDQPLPSDFTYVVIIPEVLSLTVNGTHQFTAQAYDLNGTALSGLVYNWSMEMPLRHHGPQQAKNGTQSDVGVIDQKGLFAATGVGTVYVTATTVYNGHNIVGHAMVQVKEG